MKEVWLQSGSISRCKVRIVFFLLSCAWYLELGWDVALVFFLFKSLIFIYTMWCLCLHVCMTLSLLHVFVSSLWFTSRGNKALSKHKCLPRYMILSQLPLPFFPFLLPIIHPNALWDVWKWFMLDSQAALRKGFLSSDTFLYRWEDIAQHRSAFGQDVSMYYSC